MSDLRVKPYTGAGNGEAVRLGGFLFAGHGSSRLRTAWVLQLLVQCSFLFYQAEAGSSHSNHKKPRYSLNLQLW